MFRVLTLAGLLVSLAPVSATAQDSQDTTAAPKAPEKKICRRAVATGSVMAKVTCRTKAEWDAISAKSQDDIERQAAQERARGHVMNNKGL